MYAKTTLSEEFSDSNWVIRAKVLSADNHWSDVGESWTMYHLRVLKAFKGEPPSRVDLFTYRNSGGFYLEKGTKVDLGGEYLLFLDPIDRQQNLPTSARDASEVNYNCGQSTSWLEVSQRNRQHLAHLATANR